jgi:hypothetical protein
MLLQSHRETHIYIIPWRRASNHWDARRTIKGVLTRARGKDVLFLTANFTRIMHVTPLAKLPQGPFYFHLASPLSPSAPKHSCERGHLKKAVHRARRAFGSKQRGLKLVGNRKHPDHPSRIIKNKANLHKILRIEPKAFVISRELFRFDVQRTRCRQQQRRTIAPSI